PRQPKPRSARQDRGRSRCAGRLMAPDTPSFADRPFTPVSQMQRATMAGRYHSVAREADSTIWRGVAKWTAGGGLFLALLAMLTSLLLFQLTAEGSAKRTLRRSVAALSEIDLLLDRQYDDLQQR